MTSAPAQVFIDGAFRPADHAEPERVHRTEVRAPHTSGVLRVLDGTIRDRGVVVPVTPEVYNPILDELGTALSGLTPRAAEIPLYSTVTGAQLSGEEFADPGVALASLFA